MPGILPRVASGSCSSLRCKLVPVAAGGSASCLLWPRGCPLSAALVGLWTRLCAHEGGCGSWALPGESSEHVQTCSRDSTRVQFSGVDTSEWSACVLQEGALKAKPQRGHPVLPSLLQPSPRCSTWLSSTMHPCARGSGGPSTGPQPQALSAGDHGRPPQTLSPTRAPSPGGPLPCT